VDEVLEAAGLKSTSSEEPVEKILTEEASAPTASLTSDANQVR